MKLVDIRYFMVVPLAVRKRRAENACMANHVVKTICFIRHVKQPQLKYLGWWSAIQFYLLLIVFVGAVKKTSALLICRRSLKVNVIYLF